MAAATEKVKRFLPFEITEIIVLKLPVKFLLRFKSVSKQWYSLISSDSQFAKLYHQKFISKSALRYRPKLEEANLLDIPIEDCTKLLCWCEGTFLFGNKKKQNFVFWNQSTGDYTKFSSPNNIDFSEFFGEYYSFGICFDAANYDYKVVCVYSTIKYIGTSLYYFVYSCNNNSWSDERQSSIDGYMARQSSIDGYMVPKLPPGIYADGFVYWKYENCFMSSKFNDSTINNTNNPAYTCEPSYTYEICCFDPKDCKLEEFSMPESFDPDCYFQLSSLGGQLCICRYGYDLSMVEIWIMKERNSWTKLITIDNNAPVFGNFVFKIYEYIFIYSTKDNKFDRVKFEFDQGIYDESKMIIHHHVFLMKRDLISYFNEESISSRLCGSNVLKNDGSEDARGK